jgi:RNA polymerase sigma factor (sigma-70 family)
MKFIPMKHNLYNSYELWKQFKNGDSLAFQLIYNLNHKILISYGKKITRDDELIRDTIQDLFVNLWTRKHNLSDTDNIEPYLKTILRHELIRKTMKSQISVSFEVFSEQGLEVEKHFSFSAHENEDKEETFSKLEKALKKLPTRASEALKMRYFDKKGNQEIAELMNINYQSVNNHIHRGIEALRLAMK